MRNSLQTVKIRKMTSKEMFCEFCSLQFGNQIVFKLHLKLVHNIIKEDEEMTLVKPKERKTLTYLTFALKRFIVFGIVEEI